jgi:hypothetical protein
MAEKFQKPTASSYEAGTPTERGLSPLQWSDTCFLCGKSIGESDPRGFYQGSSALMLCHRGCLNVMNAHGGSPPDYHRAAASGTPPVTPTGPSWMEFPDLAALQVYTVTHGDISRHVKVSVAGKIIQDGS